MKPSYIKGISFGLTSGIITTLGMMVGMNSGTHLRLAVIGGVLTIAIADAFSDALGIHISEESLCKQTKTEVWESTVATFFAKLIFALTFLVPLLLFELSAAIIISIVWGMFWLGLISFWMARKQKEPVWKVVGEHWAIALVVIIITHYVGEWINLTFGGLV